MSIHPYVPLFYNIVVPLSIMLFPSPTLHVVHLLTASLVLLVGGRFQRWLKFIVLYALFLLLQALCLASNLYALKFFGQMFLIMANFLPCLMIASLLLKDYRQGQLLAAFVQLGLPRRLTIALMITLRYIPTFKREFGIIREAMRLRGLPCTLLRPWQSFRSLIAPQLFRCLLLAGEITAAGLSKGIDAPCRRSTYSCLPFRTVDVLLIVFLLTGLALTPVLPTLSIF